MDIHYIRRINGLKLILICFDRDFVVVVFLNIRLQNHHAHINIRLQKSSKIIML